MPRYVSTLLYRKQPIGGDVFFARARALLRERRREEEKRVRESVSGAFACGDSRDDVRPMRRCVE